MTEANWQTYLTAQGAVYEDNVIQHFGDAEAALQATATSNTLCDLSHLGLIAVSGEDATSFLQGQVTNDVKALDGSKAHYSGYCSPKGRLLALFLAFSTNNNLYLQLSQSLLTPIMKRLNMFVMRAKVNIKDVSHDFIRFGLNGPQASALLAKTLTTIPVEHYALSPILKDHQSIGAVIKLPSIEGHQRYEIIVDAIHASSLWDTLKADCQLVGKPCWDWLDIQAGLPEVVNTTQEQFVPQMLNLDLLNGISFKKGCYTGQEIVARTHYLGKVKRRTYLATIDSPMAPKPGDKVLDHAENEAGQIVKVAPNVTNGFDVLIETRMEAKAAGNMTWHTYPVSFGTLPYLLESD